ncbi:hypothetical protein AAHA92_12214 [Salvia divinorum]|uniref:Uncharacterized protein n=1 Tax=Salvia divinorum TaxID=28513 RepID=A0ABD1HKI1_SALDI
MASCLLPLGTAVEVEQLVAVTIPGYSVAATASMPTNDAQDGEQLKARGSCGAALGRLAARSVREREQVIDWWGRDLADGPN